MKKALILLIVAVMLVTTLYAGGNRSSSGRTRVEFWGHENDTWNNSWRSLATRFNSSQTEVEVVPTFFPYDEFEAKIQTSLMAGAAGADAYEMWGGWALDFIGANALSEVPTALINDLRNDTFEPVMGALERNGRYFGVPLEFNIEYGGMFVNKPRFQQQGIPYPQTWDEVIDVARRTTVRRGDIFDMRGLDFTTLDTLTYTFLSMIMSRGGQYWVNGRLNFSSPIAVEALQTLVNYIVVDRITNLDSATGAEGIADWEFMGRDQAMMVPRGPWPIGDFDHDFGKQLGVDFDYVSFPFWGPTRAFPAETGWSLCVARASRVPEAAWRFISFALEPANMLQHNVICAQVPARRSVAQNPAYLRQAPFMAPVLNILQYGKFIGPFNTEVLKANLSQVFISLCTRDGTYASVEAALRALENQCNTELRL